MGKERPDIQVIHIGNITVFQHYYTLLYDELMYFLSSYIEDEVTREDLIQDVWLKLWEKRDTFCGEQAFRTYVFRAVRNAAINLLRKRSSAPGTEPATQAQTVVSEDDDILSQMIEAEVYSQLNQVFNQLSPSCKRTYIERLQGKSLKEIAETLDITINTVKKHINNANHFLKKMLSNDIFFFFLITPDILFYVFI